MNFQRFFTYGLLLMSCAACVQITEHAEDEEVLAEDPAVVTGSSVPGPMDLNCQVLEDSRAVLRLHCEPARGILQGIRTLDVCMLHSSTNPNCAVSFGAPETNPAFELELDPLETPRRFLLGGQAQGLVDGDLQNKNFRPAAIQCLQCGPSVPTAPSFPSAP